jgi:hypothetical protein
MRSPCCLPRRLVLARCYGILILLVAVSSRNKPLHGSLLLSLCHADCCRGHPPIWLPHRPSGRVSVEGRSPRKELI